VKVKMKKDFQIKLVLVFLLFSVPFLSSMGRKGKKRKRKALVVVASIPLKKRRPNLSVDTCFEIDGASPHTEFEEAVSSDGCKIFDRDSYCSAKKYMEQAENAFEKGNCEEVLQYCSHADLVCEKLLRARDARYKEEVEAWIARIEELRALVGETEEE
jgi:hypothetical protein